MIASQGRRIEIDVAGRRDALSSVLLWIDTVENSADNTLMSEKSAFLCKQNLFSVFVDGTALDTDNPEPLMLSRDYYYLIRVKIDLNITRQIDLMQLIIFFAYLKTKQMLNRVVFEYYTDETGKTENDIIDTFIPVHRMMWCVRIQEKIGIRKQQLPEMSYSIKNSNASLAFNRIKINRDSDVPNNFIPAIPINDKALRMLRTEVSLEELENILSIEKTDDKKKPEYSVNYIELGTSLTKLYLRIAQNQFSAFCTSGALNDVFGELKSFLSGRFADQLGLLLFSFFLRELAVRNPAINSNDYKKWLRDLPQVFLEVFKKTQRLHAGMVQAFENVVNHSETGSGYFSLRAYRGIGNKGDSVADYLREEYGHKSNGTEAQKSKTTVPLAVEIIVQDLGIKNGIMDTFKTKLDKERCAAITVSDYDEVLIIDNILNDYQSLTLAHLCRNIEEGTNPQEIDLNWNEYVRRNMMKHTGLTILRNSTELLGGILKIASSNSKTAFDAGININAQQYIANSDNFDSAYSATEMLFIPGTLIQVVVPAIEKSYIQSTISASFDAPGVIATYETFASFIDAAVNNHTNYIKDAINQLDVISDKQDYKDEVADKTTTVIHDFLKAMPFAEPNPMLNAQVINVDALFAGRSSSEVMQEGFAKGFLSALYSPEAWLDTEIIHIALINIPKSFFDSFRTMMIEANNNNMRFCGNIQIFVHTKDDSKGFVLAGRTAREALRNEFSTGILRAQHMYSTEEYSKIFSETKNLDTSGDAEESAIKLFPFEALLREEDTENCNAETLLHKELLDFFESDIENGGCKENGIHVRLGSKVHIDAFYNVSHVFEETFRANYIAFSLLRRLIREDNGINIKRDNLLFYGYATYSKAILNALVSICRIYSNDNKPLKSRYNFAVYQSNLSMQSTEPDVQIYLSGKEKITSDTKIINIVPISTTFSTFDKMIAKLTGYSYAWDKQLQESSLRKKCFFCNYSALWIRDIKGTVQKPSKLERDYWKSFSNYSVVTNNKNLPYVLPKSIAVSMIARVVWYDPQKCKLCFPKNPVNEVPLIETDVTSTIPTQQSRKKMNTDEINNSLIPLSKENISRLEKLEECVSYGHFVRGDNHYQFYIDTSMYYHKAEPDILEWLKDINKLSAKKAIEQRFAIIFAPEHVSNTEFPQIVNNIIYQGMANVITVNVDSKYRSNFEIEHAALKNALSAFYEMFPSASLEFCFVDDTIATGKTYHRANSLLRGLLPKKLKENPVIFSRVFVLLNRMSPSSASSLIPSNQNFHAFVNLNISTLRTGGDSCICCKLHEEYKQLFFHACTPKMSIYWAKKIAESKLIRFDKKTQSADEKKRAYTRLRLTHIFNTIGITFANAEYNTYETLSELYSELCGANDGCSTMKLEEIFIKYGITEVNIHKYEDTLKKIAESCAGEAQKLHIEHFLKIIARPFASFDKKTRAIVLRFFIDLVESLLSDNPGEKKPLVIRLKTVFKDEMVMLLTDYLLEGLCDLKSSYMFRANVIERIALFIEKHESDEKNRGNAYLRVAALINRSIHSYKDESKSILLRTVYDRIVTRLTSSKLSVKDSVNYKRFLSLLFVENSFLLYNETDKRSAKRVNENLRSYSAKGYIKELQYLYGRNIDCIKTTNSLVKLHNDIRETSLSNEVHDTNDYKKLLESIYTVLEPLLGDECVLSLWVTNFPPKKSTTVHIPTECICHFDKRQGVTFAGHELEFAHAREDVRETISRGVELSGYSLCKIGNNTDSASLCTVFEFKNVEFRKIVKNGLSDSEQHRVDTLFHRRGNDALAVYLHIKYAKVEKASIINRVARIILQHRNRLTRMFENDFANTGLPDSETAYRIAQRLLHGKAATHSDAGEIHALRKIAYKYYNGDSELIQLQTFANGEIKTLYNLKTRYEISDSSSEIRNEIDNCLWKNNVVSESQSLSDILLDEDGKCVISDATGFEINVKSENGDIVLDSNNSDKNYLVLEPYKLKRYKNDTSLHNFDSDLLQAIIFVAIFSAIKHYPNDSEAKRIHIYRNRDYLVFENRTISPDEELEIINSRLRRLLNDPIVLPKEITDKNKSSGLSLPATAWFVKRINELLKSPNPECTIARYEETENDTDKHNFKLMLRILEVQE